MKTSWTRRALVPSLGLVAILAGCGQGTSGTAAGSSPAAPAPAVTVKIVPDPATIGTFVAPSVTIKTGETVRWQFEDLNPHTVSSATFSSQPMDKGKSYSHTFTKAGTYMYHCAIHPEMMGSVTVN
ncbi:MAG: plastocyanin/azurin family copper-binding protein [Candidatus Dormibacteria bacterium]